MEDVVSRIDITCKVCDFKQTFDRAMEMKDWFAVDRHAFPSVHPMEVRRVSTKTWIYKPRKEAVSESS